MKTKTFIIACFICTANVFALKPNQILIVANEDCPPSIQLAQYYSQKRKVPQSHILPLPLGGALYDKIKRTDYNTLIAAPIRKKLSTPQFEGKIKCLLTLYGVPFKVGPRGKIEFQKQNLEKLQALMSEKKKQLYDITEALKALNNPKYQKQTNPKKYPSVKKIVGKLDSALKNAYSQVKKISDHSTEQKYMEKWLMMYDTIYGRPNAQKIANEKLNTSIKTTQEEIRKINEAAGIVKQAKNQKWDTEMKIDNNYYPSLEKFAGIKTLLINLSSDIDKIKGTETSASLDSELSMVMFDDYELYREQPNELTNNILASATKTLMVSRLDGPNKNIAAALIDKAISAEKTRLKGTAYIDSGYSLKKKQNSGYTQFDQALYDTVVLIKQETDIKVIHEHTINLFQKDQCPKTAIYCGWYSLKKYIDAFDFVDGAVGYHIASFEAQKLRSPTTTQWVPEMLKNGITATIGPVTEPYLRAFPKPNLFFQELINGKCLVEAFYKTKPFNSWQMLLIGDPLYKPFN